MKLCEILAVVTIIVVQPAAGGFIPLDTAYLLIPSKCGLDCGPEAACHDFGNNTYKCVCPHDGSYPSSDLKCPRNTVPLKPSRFSVHPSKITSTTTTMATVPDVMTKKNNWFPWIHDNMTAASTVFAGTIIMSVIVGFILVRCIRYIKKLRCAKNVQLKMDKTRYVQNTDYGNELALNCALLSSVQVIGKPAITNVYPIGQGSFGNVFKAELHTVRNGKPHVEIVAIKTLKNLHSAETKEHFLREVETMSSFNHQNILPLIGVCPAEDGYSTPWMIFEYMPYGDLANLLRSCTQRLPKTSCPLPALDNESLLDIARQVANGMKYLASQRFTHRDLACRNCLVGEELKVKIADFGMSRDVYTCDYYKVGGTRMLPIRWMSPESIVYGRFTLESDVWSYGVVLWEIYNYGKQPYYGRTNDEVLQLLLNYNLLQIPTNCPPVIKEIMASCWKTDAAERTTFSDIFDQLTNALHGMRKEETPGYPKPPEEMVTLSFDDENGSDNLSDDSSLVDFEISSCINDNPNQNGYDSEGYLRPKNQPQSYRKLHG